MRKFSILLTVLRPYCNSCFRNIIKSKKAKFPAPILDMKDMQSNQENIIKEMRLRKQEVDLKNLENLLEDFTNDETMKPVQSVVYSLPNRIHPTVKDITDDYRIVRTVGEKQKYPFKPLSGAQLLIDKDLLFMPGLNNLCGERSYYFIGDVVRLEQALIDHTIDKLLAKNFNLLSVPDLIIENTIESCGMSTTGERTQIYKLNPDIYGNGWCLSGTSEMAIAAYLMNHNFERESLPKLYAAVSRCYRAEMSSTASEKGIYRVHQFTKVEMFGVCLPDQSESLLESFVALQEELFSSYGLHYLVLDMAARELGRPAYRKFDVEAWMPGSGRYGELSSSSSCTDYQSRRLNIRSGETFLHTVNGTACAIPRTINAICETFQIEKGRVMIPEVLQPYTGFEVLGMKRGPSFHKVKHGLGKISPKI